MKNRRRGYCLNSQEIRERISNGLLITPKDDLESRIQPASFDPILGEEIFILEAETGSLFRPNLNETVYRTLLQLPQRRRQKRSLDEFEIKRGFTYLVPLEDRVKINGGESIKSSPKSSVGRIFLNTRLITDYNKCIDEISPSYKEGEELMCWLLLQPLAFNAVLHPCISLSQLRFFDGLDAELNSLETVRELEKNKIVYSRREDGELIPKKSILTEEIKVHLDLSGKNTNGIVALRARHNPEAIDLSKIGEYKAEDFFEPVISEEGRVKIENGEYYLIASREVIKIPEHLSVELRRSSHIGLRGDLHFAGFIDPGFEGYLVFEVKSSEVGDITLEEDSIPVSNLDLFRNKKPDKVYGKDMGSHYQKQVGPRTAKYFKKFDFALAAREYEKLNRAVLTQDTKVMLGHRINQEGFEPTNQSDLEALMKDVQNSFFHFRYECESDEEVLQIVPYVLIFDRKKRIFSYMRAENIEDYGDTRLFGKHSIGVGGHIIRDDAPDYVINCIERELGEEVKIAGRKSKPNLVGTLVALDAPVDRVHFGLVYTLHCDEVRQKEASIKHGRMLKITEIMNDPAYTEKYETWSRILIPYLDFLAKVR
ncbi:2'-deoxycytidine 5'-triphosphate deaminase [Candidatus Pacearchaeota archaeon]|nr:2'-deoxycytidine 5'-triphosphate deaminase [Candidatus Pacearchaeota archaeon]